MGEKKTPKVPGALRAVLAKNVRRLMERRYGAEANKPGKLAKESGASLSTVQRILAGEVGASLDTIEAIGEVFDVPVQALIGSLTLVHGGKPDKANPLNPDMLALAIESVDEAYRLEKKTPTSAAKARMVVAVYDTGLKLGYVDVDTVKTMLRLVS